MVYRGRNKSKLGGLAQTKKRNIAFQGGSSSFNEATGKRMMKPLSLPKGQPVDKLIIEDKKTEQKLKELNKQGISITNQVEMALPSAKAPIVPAISSVVNKSHSQISKGLSKMRNDIKKVKQIPKKVSAGQSKLVERVKGQIAKQEAKLSKLRKLLLDCENC